MYQPPALGALVGGGDLDALVAMTPGALTDQELREALRVADRLRARLDGVAAGLTGAFDARMVWAADGAKTAGSWLATRCDVTRGGANAEVRLARAVRDTPAVEAAALGGRIGREKVKALLWARQDGLEDLFAADEADLVRAVEGITVARAWRYLRRWVDDARARAGVNEPDGPEPKDGVGGSKVTLDMALEGRWFGSMDLRADDGEIVANAIDGLMDSWWKSGVFHTGDGLTMGERKARAFVELITRGTQGGPREGAAKPLILALVDAATLLGFPGTRPSSTDRLFDTEDGNDPTGDGPAGTRGDVGVVARRRRPPPGPSPPGDAPDPETDLLTRLTRRRIDALIAEAQTARASQS